MADEQWLTYAEAAERVKSSVRTVRNWAAWGMPLAWAERDGQKVRVVDVDVLLAFWRERMAASPVHAYRMRRRLAEEGIEMPIPEHVKAMHRKASETRRGTRIPATPEKPGDGTSEPATDTPPPIVDPLADMKPLKGGDEYRILAGQLRDMVPRCAGMPEYTADRLSPNDRERLAAICAGCPLLEQCRAFAIASRPVAGFWPTEVIA